MKLSEEAIQKFKKIYKEECGVDISDKKALEEGIRLLKLFRIVYRPIRKEIKKEC